jgi:hypothetical protein
VELRAKKATRKLRLMRLATRTKVPEVVTVVDSLAGLQAQIGGDLEAVPDRELNSHGVVLYVDEEGGPDLKGLPVTLRTPDGLVLRGPLLFARLDGDGNTVSLTESQRDAVREWLKGCWKG